MWPVANSLVWIILSSEFRFLFTPTIIIIIIYIIIIIIIIIIVLIGAFISIFPNRLKVPQSWKLWSLLPMGAT